MQSNRQRADEFDSEILCADGFDDALIGVTNSWGPGIRGNENSVSSRVYRAVYDIGKCLTILMERDGLSMEDAAEHLEFNVFGSFVGERTPVFVTFFDD